MLELEEKSVYCCSDSNVINIVNATIKEIKSDGIEVILVLSPYFAEGLSKLDRFDNFIHICEQLSTENGCSFLNFLDDPICTDSSLFSDCMHLNYHGADIFSTKLALAIDSIIHHLK